MAHAMGARLEFELRPKGKKEPEKKESQKTSGEWIRYEWVQKDAK